MRHLSYANVVATLALFAALGGSAYATVKITGKQVADGSLTGKDVRNRSLSSIDFKRGVLRAGPQGPVGPAGPAGAAGKDGAPGAPGAPGSARAYALVDPVGAYPSPPSATFPRFADAHTKGFTAVSKANTGIYCLAPAAGIDPATSTAIAVPDWAASSGENTIVSISNDAPNNDCGADKFEVHTFHQTSSAAPADDIGFVIVVL